MPKGKITSMENVPNKYAPYWGMKKPEECKFDQSIYSLAVKCARDYITKNENDESDEKKAQVAMLRYLLYCVSYSDPTKYIYSDEILRNLQSVLGRKIRKDFLFRKVIAPLRDQGIILASSVHGYKIPISIDDIYTYLNSTTSTVGPMMERMGICRKLIKQATDNEFDVFNDEAYIKYKRYFDN